MILATIEFQNGSRLQLEDGCWTGNDANLVAKARSFVPSPRYIPESTTNPAAAVAGLVTELAAKLNGKIVYSYSPNPDVAAADRWQHSSKLATVRCPGGASIDLGPDRRWTGDDPVFVAMANAFERSPRYYPNIPAGIANEVAEYLGGKVVFVIPMRDNDAPPGAVY